MTQLQLVGDGRLWKQLHSRPQVLGQAHRCLHGKRVSLSLQSLQLHGEYPQAQHVENHQSRQSVEGEKSSQKLE